MPAGLFWLQAGQTSTVAGVNNLRGLLFFELMFMSMRAMLGALFTFPSEFKMMLKVTTPSPSSCAPSHCLMLKFQTQSLFVTLNALCLFYDLTPDIAAKHAGKCIHCPFWEMMSIVLTLSFCCAYQTCKQRVSCACACVRACVRVCVCVCVCVRHHTAEAC